MDINNTPCTNTQGVMPSGDINPYMQPRVVSKKPLREFSKKETLFAFLCYIVSYLFCLSIPIHNNPLGAFIVIILMYLCTFAFMVSKGKKLQLMPVLVGFSAVATSFSIVLTSNGFLHFFSYVYALSAYCYFLYGMSGDNIFRFKNSIVIDFIKAIFVLPFASFSAWFCAMFFGKNNKSGKIILKILVGVFLAIIPTIIIILLLSYDSKFMDLLGDTFDFDGFDIFNHIVSLLFAIPVSAYVFSLYVSSNDSKCSNILTANGVKAKMPVIRIAPVVTVLTAVLPILFVYVVFFVSQWQYYISGFTGKLPKNFSYADYAREGFFQLCIVSVINLIVLVVISLFMKRKEGKRPYVLNVISIIFSVFTLVLISTAMAKMYMYIDCYGLTQLRVYASWFMVVLALVFILIVVKQFYKKLRLVVISLTVLTLMFSTLALSNVDSFIAKYNVDRYLDGTLKTVDIDAMEMLGDSAIPHLVRLADILDKENGTDITQVEFDDEDESMYYKLAKLLQHRALSMKEDESSVLAFTFAKYRAENAIESTNLLDKK